MTVLVDRERAAFTDATRLRAHSWYGLDVGAREIVLWGSPIDLTKQDVVRAIRDRLMNSRLLSAFDLGEEQFSRYAAVLRRDRPLRLYGYASALYLFARYLSRSGWKAEGGWPRVVFTTAEPLYDFQRATIESVFGCPAAVEYGSRDAGLTANECPAGGLHIAAEGMVVEVASAGCGARPSELVITNLYAYAMPIIRYRVGDLGVLDDTPCRCGRGLPCLRSIEGRRTDFLVLPNGRILHALAVIYILREIEFIDEFQVIQDRYDRLRVALVAAAGLSGPTLEMIRSKIEHLCEGTVSVEIEVTDAIAWSGGKHRYVVSTVADAYLETLLTPKP